MNPAHRLLLLSTLVLAIALGNGGCSRSPSPSGNTQHAPTQLAVPDNGVYTGAYIDFGDSEDDVTLEAIENFEKLVGKHQAIVASSSYWGQQSFPRANLEIITHYGAVPLVYWSPWDKPYEQNTGIDRFNLTAILAGKWNAYIDNWADQAKDFGKPMLVAWGLEMNGTWFPWSGEFYGREKVIATVNGKKIFAGPDYYKKAYRYVVDRVRARGVRNIQWVFHVNSYSYPQEMWNQIVEYYPGPDYVDWIGMSAYGMQFKDDPWVKVEDAFEYPYQDIAALDPSKPLMLAEWGIGEFPHDGNKGEWVKNAFSEIKNKCTRVKAIVFWHERWENEDGSYSNLRVQSSPGSLDAYRAGVADPYWLGTPKFK
jgi:beta-mannanase